MMYEHKKIEKKWQNYWEENNIFKTTEKSNKKFYVLDMFPYPSGAGLHVGHPEGYTATDIVARYKRLKGFDVLHPIGWDAFGLPAEQYAIKTGNHPKEFTQHNINNFRRQIKSLGFSYDYNKEIDTTDPKYYKQTQWIFSQMYKNGLAEIKDIEVNWCQELGTVLANEEVLTTEDGRKVSERGEFPVIKKPMKQWVLKITEFADELLEGLEEVDWPNSLKSLQRNWIGKEVKNGKVSYHLRDWIFARQRYWGEPFPIAFDEENNVLLIEDLVELPEMDEIKPSGNGESPLANNIDWLYFEIDGKKYRRDTNTMPQWAGSSWYYIAYILKNSDGSYEDLNSPEAKRRMKKWLPVDLYVGGQEHAVLHLLYARFWHKVLHKIGVVPTSEPFHKVVNQGMILGTDGLKMSKSKGNVINPDDIVEELGADTLRVYEMFMGPLIDTKAWSTESIKGIRKWLERVERMYSLNRTNSNKTSGEYNKLVKELTKDIEELKFNTAISKLMVYVNSVYKVKETNIEELKGFAIMLSIFAPHLAEELMENEGYEPIHKHEWPTFDEKLIKSGKTTIVIQVLGKLRAAFEFDVVPSKEEIIEMAKKHENVKKFLTGEILKIIYIPNKLINFVVK
ncbi:class I tRNA ligase family protein [Mycoplasma marinum]